MSDADDQMGGQGGQTGKDPGTDGRQVEQDPARLGKDGSPAEHSDQPGGGQPTGEGQAVENAENDPPA